MRPAGLYLDNTGLNNRRSVQCNNVFKKALNQKISYIMCSQLLPQRTTCHYAVKRLQHIHDIDFATNFSIRRKRN